MAKKITLRKLTEEIIRESKGLFTINDFSKNLESRWEKQISEAALKKVKGNFTQSQLFNWNKRK
ncbi:MAG: hypothetical protein Ct9H300mP23_10340 [Nitrospinota bacterium]|nr:MAG: hypothetical protein Ct9H300mP23_10340 [Nitrospinota bacterium]